MTRARNVAFEVHRPAQPPAAPASDAARGFSFTDLLRQRRQPGAARPFGEKAKVPPEALAAEPRSERSEPVRGIEAEPQPEPDWADAVVPSAEQLHPLLHGSARVARVAAPPHPLVASIAQTIARFCNERAVDDSEGWQVRMPLRPDVLPETTLQLSVSSCWLQLRFETADSKSRDLLFIHRDALGNALEESLNRRRDVAIVID